MATLKIKSMREVNLKGKKVLVRLDINSPIDVKSKKIVNENRLKKSIPTLKYLIEQKCKIAIIAHQGDTLDYQNLISLKEHSEKLSDFLNQKVEYIDDVCGPAAIEKVRNLKESELIILGNVRYLSEEISTFETVVPLKPEEMLNCYLVKKLAPEFEFYINDAFAAAHRNSPSMVAFQEILPSCAGDLFFTEVQALTKVMTNPEKPSVFILGGAKISDAFGMMDQVLENKTADKILTTGIVGEIFLIAKGYDIGLKKREFLNSRNLLCFVDQAKQYLEKFPLKIEIPIDLAFEISKERKEININKLPQNEMFMDIGHETVLKYKKIIENAKTLFVNGPAGVYEMELFEYGTKALWEILEKASGYSVIGGGDTVTAAGIYCNLNKINYVCTAGGAMVRFLSGKKLPLINAMEKAYK